MLPSLPHTLWERPICSGCPDIVSLKEPLATALCFPQKCLALQSPQALTHRPMAVQLRVLG